MEDRKQLNVRIPVELHDLINNDDKPTVDIVVDALKQYYSTKLSGDSGSDSSAGNLKSEYTLRLENEIAYLRAKVDDLLRTLTQEQVLHLQTQRMLPAAQAETVKQKKWYQFWKK